MDAANYVTRSTQNLRTSIETFTDEVEGQLEQKKVCGVYITRKIIVTGMIVMAVSAVAIGLGLGLTLAGDINHQSDVTAEHRFWSIGETIEAAVGREMYDPNSTEYQSLIWLAQHDKLRLSEVTTPIDVLTQRFVVADLYFSLGGVDNDWSHKYNFLTKHHECTWNDGKTYGVFCDDVTNPLLITRIFLPSSNLVGTIPNDIGLLRHLHQIDIMDNSISGTIPNSIGLLTNLYELHMGQNQLEGTLPKSMAMLKNMSHCNLFDNQLTGSDHAMIFEQIPNLIGLNLGSNHFDGTLGKLGNIPSLEYLWFGFNKLQGLPDDFGPGSNLKELHLPGNQIVGSLPDEFFSQMSSLEMFDASHNSLTGDLPSSLGLLSNNLHTVKLTKNGLSGPIPTWLPRLLKAETIDLDDNQLSGSLPTELGDFKSLKRLNLSKNKIISRLPTEMGKMSNLGELLLSDNNLSGTVPTQIGNLFLLHSLDISTTHLFANMDEALCSARPEWGVSRVLYKVDCLRDDVTCSCATECCDGEGYCCDMMTVDTVCDLMPDN